MTSYPGFPMVMASRTNVTKVEAKSSEEQEGEKHVPRVSVNLITGNGRIKEEEIYQQVFYDINILKTSIVQVLLIKYCPKA